MPWDLLAIELSMCIPSAAFQAQYTVHKPTMPFDTRTVQRHLMTAAVGHLQE